MARTRKGFEKQRKVFQGIIERQGFNTGILLCGHKVITTKHDHIARCLPCEKNKRNF